MSMTVLPLVLSFPVRSVSVVSLVKGLVRQQSLPPSLDSHYILSYGTFFLGEGIMMLLGGLVLIVFSCTRT